LESEIDRVRAGFPGKTESGAQVPDQIVQ
jgi:hypothetical protein